MRARCLMSAALVIVTLPSDASAQLGGLVRKAKGAAQNRITENTNLKSSETFGPELTPASLDAVLRGLAATTAKLDQVKQLEPERDRANTDYAKSSTAHESDRQRYQDASDRISRCQSDMIRDRGKAAQDAYKRRTADPAEQAKVMQASMDLARQAGQLQAKGDTAGVRKLMANMAKAQGIDPAADTAAAIAACGAKPPAPAWLAEQDSLREKTRRIDGQIRQLENDAATAGASASGMTNKEYSLARERVVNWYQEARGGTAVQVFGGDERKLLESRRSEIEKYKNALQ